MHIPKLHITNFNYSKICKLIVKKNQFLIPFLNSLYFEKDKSQSTHFSVIAYIKNTCSFFGLINKRGKWVGVNAAVILENSTNKILGKIKH